MISFSLTLVPYQKSKFQPTSKCSSTECSKFGFSATSLIPPEGSTLYLAYKKGKHKMVSSNAQSLEWPNHTVDSSGLVGLLQLFCISLEVDDCSILVYLSSSILRHLCQRCDNVTGRVMAQECLHKKIQCPTLMVKVLVSMDTVPQFCSKLVPGHAPTARTCRTNTPVCDFWPDPATFTKEDKQEHLLKCTEHLLKHT